MNNKSISERLNKIKDKGPEKWLSRDLFEDEEAIARDMPRIITAKRAGKNAPAGTQQTMSDNAMKVTGSGDNVTVQTPANWKGTPTLSKMLKDQHEINHKVGRNVSDSRVPMGTQTKPKDDFGDKIKHAISPQAIQELNTVARQHTTPSSGGRANANFNYGELVIGSLLSNPDAKTIEDIVNHKIPLENIHNHEGFLRDLRGRDPNTVLNFADNFRRLTREYGFSPKPEDIWIRSTNQQLGPESVVNAMRDRDDSATADSADVLFRDRNGELRGISSKATSDAYAGSGGLEKLFNRISQNKELLNEDMEPLELGKRLMEVRNLMFRTAGLPTNNAESLAQWGPDGYKDHRSEYNDLMRNPDNPFFKRLDELYSEHNQDLIKHFLNHIYPDNLPYELWKFDNDKFRAMDRELITDSDYSLSPIGNPAQRESDRAAKRWFSLNNKQGPEMAIENRIKSQQPWGSIQYALVPWDDKKVLRNR